MALGQIDCSLVGVHTSGNLVVCVLTAAEVLDVLGPQDEHPADL
jgi:hypothetical protein